MRELSLCNNGNSIYHVFTESSLQKIWRLLEQHLLLKQTDETKIQKCTYLISVTLYLIHFLMSTVNQTGIYG